MEKIKVNETCIGCGLCISQKEEYFEFNDEGLSQAKDVEVKPEDKKELLNIVESCPVGALVIEAANEAYFLKLLLFYIYIII